MSKVVTAQDGMSAKRGLWRIPDVVAILMMKAALKYWRWRMKMDLMMYLTPIEYVPQSKPANKHVPQSKPANKKYVN